MVGRDTRRRLLLLTELLVWPVKPALCRLPLGRSWCETRRFAIHEPLPAGHSALWTAYRFA